MKCGLLGEKLGHSYSPQIHRRLGEYSYSLFEKSSDELREFLENGDFTGLNVTIPYKKAVIAHCHELSAVAQKLGAVNTIVRKPDGKLIGHNTDYFGFASMLRRSGLSPKGKRVLVLGTGGASATVQAVLREMGANVAVISRTGKYNYDYMYRYLSTAIIVNATPVGMYPNNGETLVDLDRFPRLEGVLDLVYNPARTQLIMDAQKRNLVAENGLWMLVAQAKESAEWFLGQTIDDSLIEPIYRELSNQMENLVLIGMPGCGKSTVGKLLAHLLNRPFYDADAEIEKYAGISIPEIFSQKGEQEFRKIETAVLRELCKQSSAVIATGGGCVTRPENYPILRQNSHIIWLQRNLYSLATDGRPLSQSHTVFDLYESRKELYFQFSDYSIQNDSDPETTVSKIILAEESQ